MNYQFENRYHSSSILVTESLAKIYRKRLDCFGGLMAIISIYLFVASLGQSANQSISLNDLCTICALFSLLLISHLSEWLFDRMEQHAFQGKDHEIAVQFGRRVLWTEGPFSISFPYKKLRKIICLNHACLLQFGSQTEILLRYDSFTKGPFSKLLVYLKDRCPNVQIIV